MEKTEFNNPKKISSYRDLVVWQKAMDFSVEVYKATQNFPKSEIYALASQLQRAVVSVASNIAEGSARKSTLEFTRFLSISLGSLVESETQITIAARLGYISSETENDLLNKSDIIGKMLQGLINSLKQKTKLSVVNNHNTQSTNYNPQEEI